MQINIYVLLDELAHKRKNVSFIEKVSMPANMITSIRKLHSIAQPLKCEHLYICTNEEYIRLQNKQDGAYFAISGIVDKALIYQYEHHAFIFPESIDVFEIWEILQDAFDMYKKWYDQVLESIHLGDDFQGIFEQAVKILDFPVGLFDKHSVLIAKAGNIPKDVSHTIWSDVLENQHFSNDEIPSVQSKLIYEGMMKNQWPIQYQSKKHAEYHLTSALFLKDQFLGIIGAASPAQFSNGQTTLYWNIKKLLELALLRRTHDLDITESTPYFIERMLLGYNVENNLVAFQLKRFNWNIHDDFFLICFRLSDGSALYDNDSQRYIPSLKELFPISIIFYYEGYLISIIRAFGRMESNIPILEKYLKKTDLLAGISLQYQNFMHLEYAYIQCKHALQYGNKKISMFKDIYNICLIETLHQATSLKSICHPRILNYWQQGGKRAQEFIQCLKVYLQNGRNLTDSAKKLSLHRNTLIYRIEQMGKMLDLDLKSDLIEDNFISLLITSCEITQYLQKKDNIS